MTSVTFWNKKSILAYILSVLVFTIHISTLDNYVNYVDFDIKYPLVWFVKVFSRVAVPTFYILSGALFYRNYKKGLFKSKMESRFHTLVIPYLAWNTIWMFFGWVTTLFFSKYFVGRPPSDISFIGAFVSIFFHGDNLPFWFIGNLILLILASPVIFCVLKDKVVGFASLIIVLLIVYVLNIHYAAFLKTYFVDAESIVYYMLGAYIGIHGFEWLTESTRQKTLVGLAIVLFCILVRSIFDAASENLLLRTLCLSIYGIGLFFALDLFKFKDEMPIFVEHSFWVYAMHLNVSAVITKLLFLTMPKTTLFAWLNLFVTVIATFVLIEICNRIIIKYCPKLYVILSGQR